MKIEEQGTGLVVLNVGTNERHLQAHLNRYPLRSLLNSNFTMNDYPKQIAVIALDGEMNHIYYQNGTGAFYKLEKLSPDDVVILLKGLNKDLKI